MLFFVPFRTTLTSQHIYSFSALKKYHNTFYHSCHNYVIIPGFHHLTYVLPSPFILLSHIWNRFYIFAFLLHIRITILFLLQYIIWLYPPPIFFLWFISCIFLLHPFGYLSSYLSVSIFKLSLALPFYCLLNRTTFLFSSSDHITSSYLCYFQGKCHFLPGGGS